MKSNKKNYIYIFFAGIIIGMIIKFSAPFSFFNFGWAKVFNINDLNYSSGVYGQSLQGQGTAGGACGT